MVVRYYYANMLGGYCMSRPGTGVNIKSTQVMNYIKKQTQHGKS